MRPPRPLVIVGLIALTALSIALALLASTVRATPIAQADPTASAPPIPTATQSVAGGLPIGAAPLAVDMQAAGQVVAPGGDIQFQLTVRSASTSAVIQTRSFLSGPAEVIAVQASGGNCTSGNPVVCQWTLGDHAGSATIVARVAPQAAGSTAIAMQTVAQDSSQYSAASNPSVALVPPVDAAQLAASDPPQAATPDMAPTEPAATAAASDGELTPGPTAAATAVATPAEPDTQPAPAITDTIGQLPETAAFPFAPALSLGLLGCALIVLGLRRVRAADQELRAQGRKTRHLAAIITAIGYLQRRTRTEVETMDASSRQLHDRLEKRERG
jgi:hypothetical protein